MFLDLPPSPPDTHSSFSYEWTDASFMPGNINQDIYTLPLELGLIQSLNYFYTPRSRTFLISDEDTNLSNNATTYTRSEMLPYAVGTGALVFGGLFFCKTNFKIWPQARGFAHALLLSEVANSSAKLVFQKKRPNYDAQLIGKNGQAPNDSRASFYSGHSTQAFAFSTYTSLLMFGFSDSIFLSTLYSALSYTAAGIISYSRVEDHAHNLSDVVVGAVLGTTISALTYYRVQDVVNHFSTHSESLRSNWNINPGITYDTNGKTWYTANVELEML